MTLRHRSLIAMLTLTLSLLLAACSSSPKEQFHTLRPASSAAASRSPTPVPRWRLAIAPVAVPALLDRSQWVVRQADQGLRVYEQQRWAQPLAAEIAETLADAVTRHAAQMPAPGLAFVRSAQTDAALDAPLELHFQVLKLDSIGGPALAIDDQFEWVLRCRTAPESEAQSPGVMAHYLTQNKPLGPVPIGESATQSIAMFDRLAQAHGQALQVAAAQIAAQAAATRCGAP